MSATLINAGAFWTAVHPASSPVIDSAQAIDSAGFGIDGGALWLTEQAEVGMSGLRPRDLHVLGDVCAPRGEQRAQDVRGRNVPVYLVEGTEPSAPAMAHVNARFVPSIGVKGGSGPYPWRRPV